MLEEQSALSVQEVSVHGPVVMGTDGSQLSTAVKTLLGSLQAPLYVTRAGLLGWQQLGQWRPVSKQTWLCPGICCILLACCDILAPGPVRPVGEFRGPATAPSAALLPGQPWHCGDG